ncbi:uncharacterized protein LOC128243516 [Mya arenaria]|uniref:uncharacterized protein LOC128243516 n=1 Tax=Mya arenaria TaxID=6604 RepID=UPI0022E08D50|nr:uncharacterized protein LOC128243516 [Mya arenaria]XP_052817285.1 uncharacterized protein LOC128243516 [Mya arenaria]
MANQNRKKAITTKEDWESLNYPKHGKKTLVVYFSQLNPIGRECHAKVKEEVVTEASKLVGEEVDIDIAKLDEFLVDIYGKDKMEVKFYRNQKASEIENRLVKLAKNGWEYEAFFFVFLTYLDDEKQSGVRIQAYDKAIHLDFLFNPIKNAPSMALKPKIFLIQADDIGMLYPTHVEKAIPDHIEVKKIPTDADRLVILSTIPQKLTPLADKERDKEKGKQTPENDSDSHQNIRAGPVQSVVPRFDTSVLIRAFLTVMNNDDYRGENLLSNSTRILGEVCNIVEPLQNTTDYDNYDIPLPLVTSTLTKLYFL